MTQPSARGAVLGALLLALVCAWPFVATAGFAPMTTDSVLWIGRGSPGAPGWSDWVFRSDHFTWYRPVAALSFAPLGTNVLAQRALDLGLHLAAGVLLALLIARLRPGRPWWVGALAALLFLAHPAADQVVPYLARRSYSLSAALGLAGLCVAAGRADKGLRTPRALGAGALLAAAFLANEAGFVFAPLALLIAWTRGGTGRLGNLFAVGAPAVLAFALHTAVLGGLGGYGEAAAVGQAPDLGRIGIALTRLDWSPAESAPGLATFVLLLLFLAGGALWLLRRTEAAERSPLPLVAVLAFALLLCMILWSGRWFPRQVYVLQLPLAAALALLLDGAAERLRKDRARLLAACVPVTLFAGGALLSSPVLKGQSEKRMARWAPRQEMLGHLEEDLAGLEGPGTLHLVLPNLRPQKRSRTQGPGASIDQSLRHPLLWALVLLRGRDVQVSDWVHHEDDEGPARFDGATLTLPAGGPHFIRTPAAPAPALEWAVQVPGYRALVSPDPVDLDTRALTRPGHVYIASPGGGQLTAL